MFSNPVQEETAPARAAAPSSTPFEQQWAPPGSSDGIETVECAGRLVHIREAEHYLEDAVATLLDVPLFAMLVDDHDRAGASLPHDDVTPR